MLAITLGTTHRIRCHLAWRWMFVLAGFSALCGLLAAPKVLGSIDASRPKDKQTTLPTFDNVGFVLLLVAGSGLTVTLGNLGGKSLTDPAVFVPLFVTIVTAALFVAWELTAPNPLVPMRMLFSQA